MFAVNQAVFIIISNWVKSNEIATNGFAMLLDHLSTSLLKCSAFTDMYWDYIIQTSTGQNWSQ